MIPLSTSTRIATSTTVSTPATGVRNRLRSACTPRRTRVYVESHRRAPSLRRRRACGRTPGKPAPTVPPPPMDSFAAIPVEVTRRVAAGEHVALIMLDGLGAQLLARHGHHPFVRRLALTPLRSQFPPPPPPHVTTVHYGLPVEAHGLYEWNILEPTLGELICPLMFEVAGGHRLDWLAGRLDPQ